MCKCRQLWVEIIILNQVDLESSQLREFWQYNNIIKIDTNEINKKNQWNWFVLIEELDINDVMKVNICKRNQALKREWTEGQNVEHYNL